MLVGLLALGTVLAAAPSNPAGYTGRDVVAAARYAADHVPDLTDAEREEVRAALVAICHRESRCLPVGPHEGDLHLAEGGGWYGQVRLGHLDPSCQRVQDGPWSTRGAWGLSASSHWEYLPRCYKPGWLDLPRVSAWVAAQKYVRRCLHKPRRPGWCGRKPRRR